jgi:pimeloyl-ACP methyl ester carboxylesterase
MAISDYFVEQGSGDPIVFIHGSFANTSTWKQIVAELAGDYHCICIKQPGHGGAPDPDDFDAPSVETEVKIVEQVVQHLGLGPIHLVAHSYGGVVATALALKGSVDIRLLTLFEPVTTGVLEVSGQEEEAEAVRQFCLGYRAAVAGGEQYACRRVIDFWGGEGLFEPMPEFIKEAMEPLTPHNIRHWDLCQKLKYPIEEYAGFQAPVRVVCGDQSNPILRTIAACLQQHFPDAHTDIISGATHFLATSHWQACLEHIRQQEARNL